MNAMLPATIASDAATTAAIRMSHRAEDRLDDQPVLLDLMHGDPDQVDAFFERMFAD